MRPDLGCGKTRQEKEEEIPAEDCKPKDKPESKARVVSRMLAPKVVYSKGVMKSSVRDTKE